MAIISCPECKNEISDKAKSCPHCGFPLKSEKTKDNEETTQTIQLTKKKYKIQQIFMFLLAVVGLILVFRGCVNDERATEGTIGLVLLLIAAIWYLIVGFWVWWHHK